MTDERAAVVLAGVRTEAFDETKALFRDVLGLSVAYEESGFAMLALPDADRDFVEVFDAARGDIGTLYEAAPVVGLLVDDLEEARAELVSAGAQVLDDIQAVASLSGYRFFHVRGPDGNVYALVEGSSTLRR